MLRWNYFIVLYCLLQLQVALSRHTSVIKMILKNHSLVPDGNNSNRKMQGLSATGRREVATYINIKKAGWIGKKTGT